MEETLNPSLRDEFHSLNNWLNKITTLSGLTRYELETKGFDLEKSDEEKERFIKLFSDIEEYALKTGEILKKVRKSMNVK
ncbi:MAG: hypothetical protein KJ957_02815 [Candidatus Omnitrophica bacterium]|nr:hypothetical protein [Candidatus Omnitrophota bacterium]MBU1852961.1 hypothetical protein [Candidatus Omnitrophota bacterium]